MIASTHRIHGTGISTCMKAINFSHSCRQIYHSSHGSYMAIFLKRLEIFQEVWNLNLRIFDSAFFRIHHKSRRPITGDILWHFRLMEFRCWTFSLGELVGSFCWLGTSGRDLPYSRTFAPDWVVFSGILHVGPTKSLTFSLWFSLRVAKIPMTIQSHH